MEGPADPMRILFAADGSEGARRAGEALRLLPLGPDTRLTVLHVLTRYVPTEAHLPHSVVAALRADEDARAAGILQEACALFSDTGWHVDARTSEGHPAERIVAVADEEASDLVVTGAMGLSGWRRALLGSVSMAVVKHAPCAVWVVKRPAREGPMNVLVATDGSDHARHAIRTLCRIPLPEGSTAHLVYAVPSLAEQLEMGGGPLEPPVSEPVYEAAKYLREHAEHVLKEDAEALSGAFGEVRPVVEEGEPRRAILRAADAVDAELVVVGTKGLSGIREILLGSVSHRVLKYARPSVLIVPLPAR
jgi:nucleotide-binding universal stress UspA family protein